VTKAGGGDEVVGRRGTAIAKQTICLATIACLAMGMCQTNNRIPVAFRSCQSGDHSSLNSIPEWECVGMKNLAGLPAKF
jgi:hypothetical protein